MPVVNRVETLVVSLYKIELLSGNEVMELISSEPFLKEWDKLYRQCPWATVYQCKEFVTTWYKIYHKVNIPIVVTATYGEQLTGLLTLAINESGLIVGAGSNQAEYHTWLSQAGGGESFIKKALLQVQKNFPGRDISFRFIQEATPLEWATTDPQWKNRCVLKSYNHPLVDISKVVISRSRKDRINRLKKQGELVFHHITDSATFHSIFDELAAQYDFRKGTMFNRTPFQETPLKKQFLLALFDTGILHATVLKLNDQIIASNIGTIGNKWLHLQGINTHSPIYSKHSPGILHLLFLNKLLAKEGYEIFDLTPGDNGYKEMLATKQVVAHELIIAGSRSSYFKRMLKKKIHEYVLKHKNSIFDNLGKLGLNPTNTKKNLKISIRKYYMVKERLQIAKKAGIKAFIGALTNHVGKTKKYRIYKADLQSANHPTITIKQDNLTALLQYSSEGYGLTKWEFLCHSMERLEKGFHVYTLSASKSLICCAWIKNHKKGNENATALPEKSVELYDVYYHKAYKEYLEHFIATAVSRASEDFSTNNIYVTTDIKDTALNQILERTSKSEPVLN